MIQNLKIAPGNKAINQYYQALKQYEILHVSHEMAVRTAFQDLLGHYGRQFGWTVVPEWKIKRKDRRPISVDGALVDNFNLTHGFWEAKDSRDDLEKEVKKKFDAGYPNDNILFQAPERVILWQEGRQLLDENITGPKALVDVLKTFFEYRPPAYDQWERAVDEFKEKIPDLAKGLIQLIADQKKTNARFIETFQIEVWKEDLK